MRNTVTISMIIFLLMLSCSTRADYDYFLISDIGKPGYPSIDNGYVVWNSEYNIYGKNIYANEIF